MIMSNTLNGHDRMQLDSTACQTPTQILDNEDEYSDFAEDPEELEIIERLLREATSTQPAGVDAPLVVIDIEDYEAPHGLHLPKVLGIETAGRSIPAAPTGPSPLDPTSVRIPDVEVKSGDNAQGNSKRDDEEPALQAADPAVEEPDSRSPLERFRRPPKKPLSVTDLVSPAWCELQYYYVLSKHGRKRRTPAMKQGSAIHQALEDEVHLTVPVTITKKEDSWGLRIWNVVQGLRTLRDTGKTRELEVWGTVGGELVNGIIDELSYDCPDPKLEEQSFKLLSKQDSEPPLPEYQASIRDFLVTSENRIQGQSIEEALNPDTAPAPPRRRRTTSRDEKRIYLTDVKTRGSSSLPTGSSMRPTLVQLHLYHHMLENLAQGQFALSQITERYGLDAHETFSDEFIAQIGSLNQEVFETLSSQSEDRTDLLNPSSSPLIPSTQDSMDILLQHSNIATLWELMMWQLRDTFLFPSSPPARDAAGPPSSTPQSLLQLAPPAPLPTRLSSVLTARYVSSSHPTGAPKVLGSKSIVFNPFFLKSYLYDALEFWRGERDPKGVEVRDAWKCRGCEFRDSCTWIHERDERKVKEAEERRALREAALHDVEGIARRSRV